MYLLIRCAVGALLLALLNLHPTMYLLILFALLLFFYAASVFTSHYVSINSSINHCLDSSSNHNLHPTMYLLILLRFPNRSSSLSDLHPTMYLLILSMQLSDLIFLLIYIPLCIY